MTRNPNHPRVVAKRYCVRDVDEPDLGLAATFYGEDVGRLEYAGIGFTFSDAGDEIADRINLDDHVGETVATVLVDLDESKSEYRIDWHVDDVDQEGDSLVDRAREVLSL